MPALKLPSYSILCSLTIRGCDCYSLRGCHSSGQMNNWHTKNASLKKCSDLSISIFDCFCEVEKKVLRLL